MDEGQSTSASEVYYFLKLVDRVSEGDASLHRRVDALTPSEREAVAREVLSYARDMENDDMGLHLIKEAIRRAIGRAGR